MLVGLEGGSETLVLSIGPVQLHCRERAAERAGSV